MGTREYKMRGDGREGDNDERHGRGILFVHREEGKDRPERREIPGILYRRRKAVSLKLRSLVILHGVFRLLFFPFFFWANHG